jgi:hypothetical protein
MSSAALPLSSGIQRVINPRFVGVAVVIPARAPGKNVVIDI